MEPLKLSLTYDPPQIALLYRRAPNDSSRHLYVIQLHGLIFLGDSVKITQTLFDQHSEYLSPDVVRPEQVQRFVEKLLDYLRTQLQAYEEEEAVSERVD